MPSKRPISVSFNLPFTEAIDALRARRVMLPDDYYMMPAVVRRDAFMISGLAGLDQVEAVKEKLASILEKGGSFKDFQGFAKTLNWDVTPAHLETIYRTAIQTAYNAGAWKHFEQSKLDSPYLMYTAVNDSRTRPAHRALSGIIRHIDDPFWDSHSPPLGFNCRCRLIALDAAQAKARSQDGRGLNKPVTADMTADKGFGHKPGQWGETLDFLEKKKLAATTSPIQAGFAARPQLPDIAKLDGDALAYVFGNGRRTGFEYLAAYDMATGKVAGRATSGTAAGVAMPANLRAAAAERDGELVVAHYHPDSSPLSGQDLRTLAVYPGIAQAVVAGLDGSLWRVTIIERGNIEQALDVFGDTERLFVRSHAALLDDERTTVIEISRLLALDQAGMIRLDTNVDWHTLPLRSAIEDLTRMFYDDAIKIRGLKP